MGLLASKSSMEKVDVGGGGGSRGDSKSSRYEHDVNEEAGDEDPNVVEKI